MGERDKGREEIEMGRGTREKEEGYKMSERKGGGERKER